MAVASSDGAAELVAEYRQELAELTYNSKPIITSLTILAGENQHASAAIAACICQHILQAAPAYKLPALYLLDSICKNLRGVDYGAHFSTQIVHVFTSAYASVAPPQRQALQHLFRTWTDARIFDLEVLQSIDNELARLDTAVPRPAPLPTTPAAPLSHEIHVNPKHREAPFPRPLPDPPAALPSNTLAPPLPPPPPRLPPGSGLLGVQEKRPYAEQGGFPDESLRRKKSRGGGKRRRGGAGHYAGERDRAPGGAGGSSWTGSLDSPSASPPGQSPVYLDGPSPAYPHALSASVPAVPPAPAAPSVEAFQQAEQLLAALQSLLPTPAVPPQAPTPPLPSGPPPRPTPPLPPGPPPTAQPNNSSSSAHHLPAPSPPPLMDLQQLTMLSSLLQTQTQTQTQTPMPPLPPQQPRAPFPLPPSATPPHPTPAPSVVEPPVGPAFVPETLRVRREAVVVALYGAFPHQCRRCGRRFSERTAYSGHLDWHFAQNKRRRERKGASRPWMASAADWGGGSEAGPADDVADGGEGEAGQRTDAEEETAAVVADEAQPTCMLCGEAFEVFWSAEDDEWMYRGATYLNGEAEGGADGAIGPIVHVKCRSDRDAQEAAGPGEGWTGGTQPEQEGTVGVKEEAEDAVAAWGRLLMPKEEPRERTERGVKAEPDHNPQLPNKGGSSGGQEARSTEEQDGHEPDLKRQRYDDSESVRQGLIPAKQEP